jgi:hypothetical protein
MRCEALVREPWLIGWNVESKTSQPFIGMQFRSNRHAKSLEDATVFPHQLCLCATAVRLWMPDVLELSEARAPIEGCPLGLQDETRCRHLDA